MKKTISLLLLFFGLLLLLFHPIATVNAAALGLTIWYQNILPALLPFAILSDILISSNAFYQIARILYPVVRLILPCSRNGTFPLMAGYLFGFPMGSRICARMVSEGKLSHEEASIIFIISNNISPVFITSYIVHDMLGADRLVLPTLLLLYVPPLLYGRLAYHRVRQKSWQKKTAPRLKMDFSIVDAGIMNGFEILCKLGGYIMLFSIFTAFLQLYAASHFWQTFLASPLEITNGIARIAAAGYSMRSTYTGMIALTSLGGLCGIAQTYSMVAGVHLPMKRYVLVKLLLAVFTGCLAYFLYPFLSIC